MNGCWVIAASQGIVLAVAFCGCSSSYAVRSTTYGEMNELFKGRYVTVELKDGKEIPSKEVRVYDDSVSWLDKRTGDESRASMEQLNKIVIVEKGHALGALEGLGLGAVGGGGLGLLLGYLNSRSAGAEWRDIGSAIGLVFGAGAGCSNWIDNRFRNRS